MHSRSNNDSASSDSLLNHQQQPGYILRSEQALQFVFDGESLLRHRKSPRALGINKHPPDHTASRISPCSNSPAAYRKNLCVQSS
jgi:hypothetical protein